MKLRNIIESLVIEGKNIGNVYHFTRLGRLISIINDNQLNARRISNSVEGLTISTTRNKNLIKHSNTQFSGDEAGLVLDGSRLSDIYQVKPNNDSGSSNNLAASWGDEMEEIWYGDRLEKDGGFRNIKKYIQKIIITKKGLQLITKPSIFNTKQSTSDKEVMINNIGDLSRISDNKKKIKMVQDWFNKQGFQVEIQ